MRLVTDPFVTGQGFVVDAVVVTGSVSGVVTAAGNPLAGVPVTADTGRWTLTDGGGNYTINDVAPGTRRLCATAPGYQNGGLAGVTVNTGTNTSGVNFALDALPPGEIFFDNFEGETACWTETGLWHQANDSGCTSLPGDSSPDPGYHSPTHSFHYAQDSTCNYSTGVNSGTLTSPVISLAGYKDPSIQFYHWRKVEYWPYFGFDQTFVEVRYAGDQTWTPVWYRDSKTFSAASWEQ